MARLLVVYEPRPGYLVLPEEMLAATGKRFATVDLGDNPNIGQAALAAQTLAHLLVAMLAGSQAQTVSDSASIAPNPEVSQTVTLDGVVFELPPEQVGPGAKIISRDVPYRWATWTGSEWTLDKPMDQGRPEAD